ncbi:MAG: choice-of-anchor D domain-containing protein, partial [Candidatus Marinimicrobia bacterium]|nr:choice-of-anchor D domain-containing protein [Candidatus Neomarinimicrobiota bacterium]
MKKHMLCIFIILLSFTFLTAADWDQITKIVASDRAANDHFGYSVAISGNFAIVGACFEDHNVSGTDSLSKAGSAYIFARSADTWILQQKIVASDRAVEDLFGMSVAISGNYAIIGAYQQDEDASGTNTLINAGAAYIFYNNGSTWTQQQKVVASDRSVYRYFGNSVAISGNYAIVGAYREDGDANGENSITQAGAAYIFYNDGSSWIQQQKIVASDRASYDEFGLSVAISGDYAIVGTCMESEDASGGNTLGNAGSAYIFVRGGETWTQQQKIVASDRETSDYFGCSVAISGDHVIVGAYAEDEDTSGTNTLLTSGSAYIFVRNVGTWAQQQKIVADDRAESNWFGYSVAIYGDHAIIGAYREAWNNGSAYIFARDTTGWMQQQKIIAPIREGSDYFGYSVDISGDSVIVGAYGECENANEENTIQAAGSVYIFSSGIGGTVDPDIYVHADSIEIINGDNTPSTDDHTDFGTTQITYGTLVETYFIANTGTGNLMLSAPIIAGTNSGDFSLLTAPSDSIFAGSSTVFSIAFTPLAVGVREATISIANNDDDENPYTFAIQGIGKAPYSGGSGTELDPYLIANYNDLLELSAMTHDWGKFFVQTANIDAEATDSLNFGDHDKNISTPEVAMGFSPIGDSPTMGDRQQVAFSGNYNGSGHTISNLYINRPAEGLIGFFGYVKDVSHTQKTAIKNINLLDIDINGHGYTGGLVGWNLDASIDSCSVNGNVTSLGGTVGGLVGFDQDIITACHSLCVVSGGTAGGLVGYKEFGKIINSSSRDMVQSPGGTAGGLVGSMYQAEIQNSQASGSVTGFRYTGGFAGKIQYRSKITNCYVRSDVTGSAPSAYNATGGFCGYVNGYGINLGSNIENCFSTSLVHYTGTADPTDRGFVGSVALTNTFTNNFFDLTLSNQLTDAVGTATAKDSIAMRNIMTFTATSTEGLTSAWDFAYNFNDDAGDDDIWDMDTSGAFNDGYPFLFWENGDEVALSDEVGVSDLNGMIKDFKFL